MDRTAVEVRTAKPPGVLGDDASMAGAPAAPRGPERKPMTVVRRAGPPRVDRFAPRVETQGVWGRIEGAGVIGKHRGGGGSAVCTEAAVQGLKRCVKTLGRADCPVTSARHHRGSETPDNFLFAGVSSPDLVAGRRGITMPVVTLDHRSQGIVGSAPRDRSDALAESLFEALLACLPPRE